MSTLYNATFHSLNAADLLTPFAVAVICAKLRCLLARKDDLEDSLLAPKDYSDEERQSLSRRLLTRNVSESHSLAKRLSVKLSGVSRKADIVERIISMVEFGCIRRPDETTTPNLAGLTYSLKMSELSSSAFQDSQR